MNCNPIACHSLGLSLLLCACGPTIADPSEQPLDDSVGQQASPVTHASLDDGHEAVVSITIAVGPDSPFLCTGTLVGPRAVLTAAHCLAGLFSTPLRIAFGADAQRPMATLRVVDRRVHPDYRPEPLADHDLAVLALERAVPSSLVPFTYDEPVTDTLVKIVGFGATESDQSLGRKRAGTARVDEVDATRFRVAPAPSLTCFHDSGAPALSQAGEFERLVGVTTSGRSDCAGFSRFMRVDADWNSFILPNAVLAESLPVPPPEAVAVRAGGGCQMRAARFPPPAPSALLTGCALGVYCRRRRRLRR
ncbi:MAG TPA: trypsin-like serine protease [Polyangiaceae bacterium]|nr:trypsin-like serine protease [Polyangiaceae bacterium]